MDTISCALTARALASEEMRARSQVGVALKLGKGQCLFHAGDPATRLYKVDSGTLMVFKMLSDGRRQIVEIVPPGWLCGFARASQYDSSCEALTDATVMAYARADLETNGALRSRLLNQAEEQFCALHDQTMLLGRKSAEERVASFLMRFIPSRGVRNCAGPQAPKDDAGLHVPLSRAEIGDHLGLTFETVSRAMTSLAKKGLISVGPRHGDIYVKEVCSLCAAARTGRNE